MDDSKNLLTYNITDTNLVDSSDYIDYNYNNRSITLQNTPSSINYIQDTLSVYLNIDHSTAISESDSDQLNDMLEKLAKLTTQVNDEIKKKSKTKIKKRKLNYKS